MGLDIIVETTYDDVFTNLQFVDVDLIKNVSWLKNLLEAKDPEARVHCRPGSYSGLKIVREQYEKLKNSQGLKPFDFKTSHLVNHSDCDGWYLPEEFDFPIWQGEVSIGSSFQLLRELEELQEIRESLNDDLPCSWGHSWDELYIAACASVVSEAPIHFK